MIESLEEVFSGKRINLHGDIDIQMMMHTDGLPRVALIQTEVGSSAPDEAIVLDANQLAHLTRVLKGMVDHGATLNRATVAPPGEGG